MGNEEIWATKTKFLKDLGTKELIEKIDKLETELEKAYYEDTRWRSENANYMANYDEDCLEVKQILADLQLKHPAEIEGKKATADLIKAWLTNQRRHSDGLIAAINRQQNVTFLSENNRVRIELIKKRLESAKGLMALRTAQINFMSD